MHLIYDQAKQKWALYRRIIPEFSERMIANESDRDRKAVDRYYRSYAYAESDDLREWKNHQFILSMDADDPGDTELYQFACHKFGQIYVGYMSVFYLRRPQSVNIHLATSRDGIQLQPRLPGRTVHPVGATGILRLHGHGLFPARADHRRRYDVHLLRRGQLSAQRGSGTVPLPASSRCGAALATFKRDRFASLETSDLNPGPCRVVTKPFTVRHPRLFLNAATWMKGSIRVEALTRDWQPIPGFTEPQARDIQGDALDHPVRWKDNADVSKLIGQGDSPQILYDSCANPRHDAERRRQKARGGRQRIPG